MSRERNKSVLLIHLTVVGRHGEHLVEMLEREIHIVLFVCHEEERERLLVALEHEISIVIPHGQMCCDGQRCIAYHKVVDKENPYITLLCSLVSLIPQPHVKALDTIFITLPHNGITILPSIL